jgi:hypothetical protein
LHKIPKRNYLTLFLIPFNAALQRPRSIIASKSPQNRRKIAGDIAPNTAQKQNAHRIIFKKENLNEIGTNIYYSSQPKLFPTLTNLDLIRST